MGAFVLGETLATRSITFCNVVPLAKARVAEAYERDVSKLAFTCRDRETG
jgi:hypothetical protein